MTSETESTPAREAAPAAARPAAARGSVAAGVVRLLAVLGPAALVLEEGRRAIAQPATLGSGLAGLAATALAAALVTLLFARRSAARLRENLELLAPLGVTVFASWVVERAYQNPDTSAMLGGVRRIPLLGFPLVLSAGLVVRAVLYVAFAAVTTSLVLDAARGRRPDLDRALAGLGRTGPRAAAACLVGWGGAYAIHSGWLGAMATGALPGSGAILAAIAATGAVGFAWSIVSALLLPVAIGAGRGLVLGTLRGLAAGLACSLRFLPLLLAQCLALGWVALDLDLVGNTTSFTLRILWLGGYPDAPNLHRDVLELLGAPDLALTRYASAFVLGALAIVVMLRMTEELARRKWVPPAEEGASSGATAA